VRAARQSLSTEGKYLLEQVGQVLQGQSDASILVTGHTDNVPTGKITSNATADGREMNRRVDIILSAM
jgi:flagellar motor protein MotB